MPHGLPVPLEGGANITYDRSHIADQLLTGREELTEPQRKALWAKFENDVSDHMPIWVWLALK